MGIISIIKASNLLWLGRYAERVYTTIQICDSYYDKMIDADANMYQQYCERLAIPEVYGNKESFVQNYIFNENDNHSMISNLKRAHDNAIVLRDVISTESLAYLEMSLNLLKAGYKGHTPLREMMQLLDDLMAFWGSLDDFVDDEECRNIIKVGRYMERMDLYFRFGMSYERKLKEYTKLVNRLGKSHLQYNEDALHRLLELIELRNDEKMTRYEAVNKISHLLIGNY